MYVIIKFIKTKKKGIDTFCFTRLFTRKIRNQIFFLKETDAKNTISSCYKKSFNQNFKAPLLIILKLFFNSELILFISDRDAPMYQGYVIAVSMYAVSILQSICLQQYYFTCYVVGMRIRTSLITVIYDKVWSIKLWVKISSNSCI